MAKLCKILFISAPIGAGHIRAAQAVSDALCKHNVHIQTQMANVFDFFNPAVGRIILKVYLRILEIFPPIYSMAYSWGNESYFALAGRKIISGYLARRMEKYILEYNPTVIVCTHATPAGLMAHLIKKNKVTIPVVAVVTDFVVHRLWIYPEIQHYIVANKKMGDFLAEYGIRDNSIEVMGIPVNEKFVPVQGNQKIVSELEFNPNVKTILIMGGGGGMLPMDDIILCCEKIDIGLQIIVVTGNNKGIYNKLVTLQPSLRKTVRILEYVNNIDELMAAADLIISKPGGMTCAETLCQGLPMLIYRPIPGQEEANANYLVKSQAALRVDSLEEMKLMIQKLFIEAPEQLIAMKKSALAISQPMAAQRIAEYLAKLE